MHNACDFNLLKTIVLLYFKKEDLGQFLLNDPENLFSVQPHLDIKEGTMIYSQNILEKKHKEEQSNIISSPEPSVQVSFSDHSYSVVRPSINF